MRDRRPLNFSLGLATWLAVTCAAAAQGRPPGFEKPIAMADVPDAVRDAVKKAAPGVSLEAATTTLSANVLFFDVYGRDGRGREVDIELSAQGAVIGIAIRAQTDEVPPAVLKAAIRAKPGGSEFTEVATVTRNGALIHYRFEGQDAEGGTVVGKVSPDGQWKYVYIVQAAPGVPRVARQAGGGPNR